MFVGRVVALASRTDLIAMTSSCKYVPASNRTGHEEEALPPSFCVRPTSARFYLPDHLLFFLFPIVLPQFLSSFFFLVSFSLLSFSPFLLSSPFCFFSFLLLLFISLIFFNFQTIFGVSFFILLSVYVFTAFILLVIFYSSLE
jgi:hypothetical protein